MKNYQSILTKELISISIILILSFIICSILFLIIKKLDLEKILYVIVSAFLVLAIVFGGNHIVKLSLDLYYNSFVSYTGKCSYPSRDTLILEERDKMKLYAAISIPNTTDDITIIYSKRSKIVLGYEK